jgi:two-component system sensor histidine kinase UhpB
VADDPREYPDGDLVERILEAQADERERVARELHDETGQSLTALLIGLRALEERASPEVREDVAQLRERARRLVAEVARLARGLHPTALDELHLSEVLEQQVAEFRENSGLDATLSIDDPDVLGPLSRAASLAVYRVVQEGLTNVWRHAGASAVAVRVAAQGNEIQLEVSDDGNGLAHRDPTRRGLGLLLMGKRVESLGGNLTVDAVPGEGTTLRVTIPLLPSSQ